MRLELLRALRAFNYEHIYVRPASLAQSRAVIEVLRALVEYYSAHPDSTPDGTDLQPQSDVAVRAAVTYVAGMTDQIRVRHGDTPPEVAAGAAAARHRSRRLISG